jgi:tetratricopeptide (TPR) repeat protein
VDGDGRISEAEIAQAGPETIAAAFLQRGRAVSLLGHHDYAVSDLTEAAEAAAAAGDEKQLATALYYRGCIRRKTDPAAAHADLTAALRASPLNARVLAVRGMLLEATGQWHEAIADYGRACEIEPDASLFVNRGFLCLRLCDPERLKAIQPHQFAKYAAAISAALECASDALRVDRSYGRAYILLAEAKRRLQHAPHNRHGAAGLRARRQLRVEAIAALGRAVFLHPADPIAYFFRGCLLAEAKSDTRLAVYDLVTYLALESPNRPELAAQAARLRGKAHLLLGEHAKALAELRRDVTPPAAGDKIHVPRAGQVAAHKDPESHQLVGEALRGLGTHFVGDPHDPGTRLGPGRPGAAKRHQRFPTIDSMKIHSVWGFFMGAQGA